MTAAIVRLLDWLFMRQRPGAMHKWGELVAEFGVLWLTFGLLEELRAKKSLDWPAFWWFLLTTAIGLGTMRWGVKIRQTWGQGSNGS